MSKLAAAISAAVLKTLTTELPGAVANKFKIDAEEFKVFLAEFLKAGPVKKAASKGRMTGYNLYSKEARLQNKSLDFKKIGEMWRALSDAEKKVWNERAKATNGASSDDEGEAKNPKEEAETSKKGSEPPSEEEPDTPKRKGGRKPGMKVSYDKSTKKWMVEGTPYYIESGKNKVIVGKLIDKKPMPLTGSDIANCERNGWKVHSVEDDDATISE